MGMSREVCGAKGTPDSLQFEAWISLDESTGSAQDSCGPGISENKLSVMLTRFP